MPTALAVAVIAFLALGASIAGAVILRLLLPRSPAPLPSLPGEVDELSLRSTLSATVRVDPTPEPMARRGEGEPDYDPTRQLEDEVPTTLFRDDDSQELVAYLADFDSDHKES